MRKLTLFFVFLSAYTFSIAQDKSVAKALKGFDELMETVMADHHVPGMAISIIKEGKVVYSKGYGYRNLEEKILVDANTMFAIGSSSKAFTAFGVMKLAEEGKLSIDKPLKTYLTDFDLSDEYIEDRMTPRDLLCHRSGLPRHDLIWYGSPKSRIELFHSLSDLEFSAGFRERWQYQNLMFMTAGVLIENISGQSWEDYTRKEIFEPLGMKRSNFSIEKIKNDQNAALPYAWIEDELIKMDYRDIDAIGPAGSINSSVLEMAEWVKMQLNKGKINDEPLLKESYFNQMHSPQMAMGGNMEDNNVFHNSYGMGWFINSYRGHKRVEHGGNIDGFSANVAMLPFDNIGVVILTNLNGNPSLGIVRNSIFDRLLGLERIDWNQKAKDRMANAGQEDNSDNEEKPVEGTQPSHSLQDYSGSYEHTNYGEMKVELENDALIGYFNSMRLELNHFHYDVFQWDDKIIGKGKIQFHMNDRGDIDQLSVVLDPNVSPIEFDKVFKEKIEIAILESYVGVYSLGQVDATISLDDNGILKLFIPGQPEYTLEPTSKTNFDISGLNGYSVEFDGGELVFNQPNGVFRAKKK